MCAGCIHLQLCIIQSLFRVGNAPRKTDTLVLVIHRRGWQRPECASCSPAGALEEDHSRHWWSPGDAALHPGAPSVSAGWQGCCQPPRDPARLATPQNWCCWVSSALRIKDGSHASWCMFLCRSAFLLTNLTAKRREVMQCLFTWVQEKHSEVHFSFVLTLSVSSSYKE